MSVEKLIEDLRNAVINYDAEGAENLAKKALSMNIDPLKVIEEGLTVGIREVGEKFANGEIFLPELIMAAEAMKKALDVLLPELKKTGKERKVLGKVVIGTVAGDIHSIGKNIVASMLIANGFEVYDIGEDVPAEKFVEKVKELKPNIVGLSALMTTTLPEQKKVIEALKREGLRDKVKVIIGGAPTSMEWAEEIGADGWAPDASEAVKVAKKLLRISE